MPARHSSISSRLGDGAEHLGLDHMRQDGVDAYAFAGVVERQHLGQSDDRELWWRSRRRAARSRDAGGRGDLHDRAAAAALAGMRDKARERDSTLLRLSSISSCVRAR